MNSFLIKKDIFYCSLNILSTGNSNFKSTIFTESNGYDIINSYFNTIKI